MKIKEIISLSNEELRNKEKECRQELFNLRFQKAVNQLKNPMRIHELKKDIARILTVINSRKGGEV